jgi:pheromone shutdown protein TraB
MNSDSSSSLEHVLAKHPFFKFLSYCWLILLLPWLPMALLSGMAFDGGPTWRAYLFAWAMWTYPLSVVAAFILRRSIPASVFLPALNVAAIVIAG